MSREYNILIDQRTDFSVPLEWTNRDHTPKNLTGATVEAQIRKNPGGPVLATFTTAIDGPAGRIDVSLPKTVTATLPHETLYYDVLVTHEGETVKLVWGRADVKWTVTQ